MDKYKKLKCVQGLIMSLEEQIYRIDGLIEKGTLPKSKEEHTKAVISYYKEIKDFLNKEEE